ncbi:MAG TPA: protein kinase [Gemmataceae bacterium]|nr:protein kinase [Gemmataceae bacterium]
MARETDPHTIVTKVPPAGIPIDASESATHLTPLAAAPPAGLLLAPPQLPDEIGRLGPYRVLARIGVGGMGLVFRAEDPQLRRLVALKVMLPQFTADHRARARFLREARAAAAVEHDHIVPIFQVGEDRGVPYLAMPLLKGESLAALLKATGPLPLFHAVRIAREVAEGLAAAHARGLIHRDVKPSNIWLEGDLRRVRILDFGLARLAAPENTDSSRLLDQDVVGTPAYMSPEQGGNEPLDGRSDLFSLGVVLYQMVSGRLPFKTGTAVVTLTSIATDAPLPPIELNPILPAELNALILKLLAKKPGDRPATAADVARRLADLEVELTAVPLPAVADAPGDPFADLDDPATDTRSTRVARAAESRRWTRIAWIAAIAFVGALLGVRLGAYLLTPAPVGTLSVGSDEPAAQIIIKHEGKIVREATAERAIALKPGDYFLELAEPKAGLRLSPSSVKIQKNKSTPVRIVREPSGPVDPPDWDRRVADDFLKRKDFKVRIKVGDKPEVELTGPMNSAPNGKFFVTGLITSAAGGFNHEDAKLVGNLSRLTTLEITGKRIGNDGLQHLAGLKTLTTLKIGATDVTDAGVKHLKGMTALTHLILDDNPITNAGLVELSGLKAIEILGIPGTGVTADGLAVLKQWPGLKTLYISKLPVTDASLDHLAGLKGLSMLGLAETGVTNAGVERLAAISGLTQLFLGNTGVTDVGFERLSRFPALTHLYLGNNIGVTDVGLARLPDTTKLQVVDLSGTAVTDHGLKHLVRLKQIKHVALHRLDKVSAAGVQNLAKERSDLTINSDHGNFVPPPK